jgi:preprotein translocase subunit SecF
MTVVDDAGPVARRPNAFVRLYRGETSFDFVGRRRWWYLLSAVVIVAGLVSLGARGLNLGIDFRGGTSWEVTAPGTSVATVQNALQRIGVGNGTVEILGGRTVQVQADLNRDSRQQQESIKSAVSSALGRIANVPASEVSITDVGPTWGSQITNKAIIAMIVFFVVVVAYISVRFEWKMAIAALIAVIHDLLVTAGIYSLTGFEVTPATVIAVLTILGYSLYDTVVVFDRVKENVAGLGATGRMTYEDVVNLSMNQTLARSINTSLVAILPVLAVLVIGAQILGATTLQYFGLALVIGLTSGAYSSIFIASPILSWLKEREPRYRTIRLKLANRGDRTGILTPRGAAGLVAAGALTAGGARTARRHQARAVAAKAQASRSTPGARQVLRPGAAKAATNGGVADGDGVEATAGADSSGAEVSSTVAAGPTPVPAGRTAGSAGKSSGAASSSPRRPPARSRKGKPGRRGGRRR